MDSLKKNKDFQNVYRNGKSYADKYLVMYVLEMVWNRIELESPSVKSRK